MASADKARNFRRVDPGSKPQTEALLRFVASTSMRLLQDAAAFDVSAALLFMPSFASLKSTPRSGCPLL